MNVADSQGGESDQFSQANGRRDLTRSAEHYRRLITADPSNVAAVRNLAAILRPEMPEKSIRLYRQCLRHGGEDAALLNDLGCVYLDLGDNENARRCFERGLDKYPTSSACYMSYAYLHHNAGNFDAAVLVYQSAIANCTEKEEAQCRLATLLREWGHLEEAISLYYELTAKRPDDAILFDELGRALLQSKQWDAGWEYYQYRFLAEPKQLVNLVVPIDLWDGQELSQKHLLVLAEQGIGDEVQFASCYQSAIDHAARCTFTCDPRLASRLRKAFPKATFIPLEGVTRSTWVPDRPADFDYCVSAGTLPKYFRRSDEDFPKTAFLSQPCRSTNKTDKTYKVGLSWMGGIHQEQKSRRTIPLESITLLFDLPGCTFVDFQHKITDAPAQTLRNYKQVKSLHHINPFKDLDSWFAELETLNLLISVDNSNVHFAGALGVETWLILSQHANWRWPINDSNSLWYPNMTLLKKKSDQSWDCLMRSVREKLSAKLREQTD